MLKNFFLFLIIILIALFCYFIINEYFSDTNIKKKNLNRINIDKKLSENLNNLIILQNDTNNVIEFNDGFSNRIKNDKKRSFWNLLKFE